MTTDANIMINSGTKVVGVNDNGDTIRLPLGDQEFTLNFLRLMQELSDKAQEIAKQIRAVKEDTSADKVAQLSTVADLYLTVCQQMKERVDAVFADEVCRKVFGSITPGLDAFSEFFEKLSPFVLEYQENTRSKSEERIKKYTEKYDKQRTLGTDKAGE